MAWSSTLIKKVTKMNRASQDANLGYVLDNLITSASSGTGTLVTNMTISGSVGVTDAQVNASAVSITTGLSAIKGWIVQTYRTGSPVVRGEKVVATGGTLTVTSGSPGYIITIGDKINWITF